MRRIFQTAVLATILIATANADDWPQWLGPQRDAVWREDGILEKFPDGGPKVLWRKPVGGGYSGPAVAGGKVYITDRQLADGAKNPDDPFKRGLVPGRERVLCLNEADGELVWKHEYDCGYEISYASGPRTTPVVAGGKVYTLGAMGNLLCLDAAKGGVLWERDLKKDYSVSPNMWGYSGHPLIDGQKLICLARGNGSTVVALDKDTGREIWKALTAADPGYAPPMIHTVAGKRQVIVFTPEHLNGLDPETGAVLWSQRFETRAGLVVSSPVVAQQKDGSTAILVTSFYSGSMLVRVDADSKAAVLWRGKGTSEKNTDGLHSIMPTPFIEDGHIYGVCSYGQLRCLKLDSGERVWESFVATGGPFPTPEGMRWANAFIIKNGERFFFPNEKGDLIIGKLSPKGFEEISRAHLLEPTSTAMGRNVVWSHPAFANRNMYARNDKEIICVSLAK